MKEEDRRPDSEQLLRSIQNADGPPGGRLKIFFGYAAGVGKTYAMLEAAHRVQTAQLTYAARNSNLDGFDIREGDYLALLNGKLFGTSPKEEEMLLKLAGAASDCTVTAEGDAPEELM